eukprot:120455-Chlamydomonas_euryale.AAC.3
MPRRDSSAAATLSPGSGWRLAQKVGRVNLESSRRWMCETVQCVPWRERRMLGSLSSVRPVAGDCFDPVIGLVNGAPCGRCDLAAGVEVMEGVEGVEVIAAARWVVLSLPEVPT